MIDNTAIIRPMLSFDNRDDFYFLQVFKRRKDNPYLGKDQVVLGSYYIDSHDDFDFKYPQIKSLCDAENARAYIRVNKRNYQQLGQHFLKRVVNIMFTENCKALSSCFASIAGEFHNDPDKKWIVDVDTTDIPFGDLSATLNVMQREAKRTPLLIFVPTKSGYHYITRPFNLKKFQERFSNIDVHKDNPTLLYCP